MTDLQKRIKTLLEAAKSWLNPGNKYLDHAIERSVQEGYFSYGDIKYALGAIEESISETAIQEWAEQAKVSAGNEARGQNVLCLHAGNLPLVGFQDAFATLLSGARYSGKISRKDPYLLPTFLNEVKKTEVWTDVSVQWSHRLDDFENMRHGHIVFAGSETSVPGVRQAISKWNLAHADSRYLIRTAHFSMAYIDRRDKHTLRALVDAVLRYGGKGCRSVAVVVSPFSLDEIRSELTGPIESFWRENPQHQKPAPRLKWQHAYNEAIERPQLWLENFLWQEGGLEFEQDFICYWVQGEEKRVAELAAEHHKELQSIYIRRREIEIPGYNDLTEPLSEAQKPPLSWKADGVDTLRWLTNEGCS